MGSFAYLTVHDYPIYDSKSSYYSEVIELLFLPDDFLIEERPYISKNELYWGNAYKEDKGNFLFKGFRQTAKVCKQRLEIYGMTLENAKKNFLSAKLFAKQEGFYQFPIHKVSFDQYLDEVANIIANKERNYDKIFTTLKESLIVAELSIYGQSMQAHLYSVLSTLQDDDIVEYDLTDIINAGSATEELVTHVDIEKIIVLTEGKTDVEFISSSLNKLYPHLAPYYHFINFEEYKVESNASALVRLVTSLAASNIKHPIIVLFDNDTTGIMEMKKLKAIKLTNNFKILKYPNISIGKKYPTIGPTGIKKMNINGLACGIEMYLGDDVLKKGNDLIPIQWKGYNDKENKYQGEILDKHYVQEKFREKLKSSNKNNFVDINSVLQVVFQAFQ